MSFRDNLQHLRATRNMTQEQLAVLVGVSRQSVTKWEAERSYPEMDKLLKICQIFDCTLDDLVQGDLTTREEEPERAVPAASLASDVVGYDEHHRTFASRMAAGIGLCIAGFGVAAALEGTLGDGPAAVAGFGGVALGLALILPAAMEHSAFQKAHPYVVDFYTADDHIAEKRIFGYRLAAGIGLILLGIAGGALAEPHVPEHLLGCAFLLSIAAGVMLIVYAGMMSNRLEVEEYNIEALEDLSEEEIASVVGQDRAPSVLAKVQRSKRKGALCGIIMLVATIIALPLMFWATQADNSFWSRFFWIPWMLGGLGCGIVSIAIDMRG